MSLTSTTSMPGGSSELTLPKKKWGENLLARKRSMSSASLVTPSESGAAIEILG
jgi:hypothetical protein